MGDTGNTWEALGNMAQSRVLFQQVKSLYILLGLFSGFGRAKSCLPQHQWEQELCAWWLSAHCKEPRGGEL